MKKTEIILEKPVIIAQAEPEIREWGPFQFPTVERLPDGRLHCRYHIVEDSPRGYGMDGGHALSADDGVTWEAAPEGVPVNGLLLPNGDRLAGASKKAVYYDADKLPRERLCETLLNAGRVSLYNPDEFPTCFSVFYLMRKKAGSTEWVEESHKVHVPFSCLVVYHNLQNLLAYRGFWRLRIGPDGLLWAITYGFTYKDKNPSMAVILMTSDDNGYHWEHRSNIYYQPDREDRYWATRTGFTEPDLAFLPDGTILCVCRTDDSFHTGPSYRFYSSDGGYTWSEQKRFDNLGVWPCLVTMKNGITLAGYGRPGLYLRASADPAAREWDERVTVVVPGAEPHELDEGDTTCAYCDILPLGDDTFYLVYSDFFVPNKEGKPCKTIMGRRGTVRIKE